MGESGASADAGDHLAQPHLPGFRALANQSALYATGGLTQKLAGLLLVPLLARVLTPAEFGRLDVLSTMGSTLTGVAVLGLDVVVTRRWADADDAGRRSAFATWLGVALLVGGLLLLALGLLGAPISDVLFGDGAASWGVRLAGAYALVNLLQTVGLTALRNQERARAYAATSVVTVVSNLALVALLVLVLRSETGVMLGITASAGVGAVISLALTRHLVIHRPSRAEGRDLLRGALPLVPGIGLTLGGDLAIRFLLLASAGEVQVGYLSLAVRFSGVGLLVITAFQLAWQPRAYAIARQPGGPARLGEDAAAIVLLLTTITAAMAAISPELLRLIGGADYGDALSAVGCALLIPMGVMAVLVTTLPSAIENRMGDLGIATAVAAATSIAVTAAAAPRFGAAGAALAVAGGQAVGAATALYLGRRARVLAVPHRSSVVLIACLGMALTVVVTVPEGGAPAPIRGALLLAFAAVVVIWERPALRSAAGMLRRTSERA